MAPRALRTPLTLAVLSLLRERPRHPYEMQALIRERHVTGVVKVRGGSLYDAIGRLQRAGLIEVVDTERAGARPERTVYGITERGSALAEELVGDYLRAPAAEYPVFVAGLAHILNLDAEKAADLLRERVQALQATSDEVARDLQQRRGSTPRVVLLEVEYAQALRQAELAWLREVITAIRTRKLPWLKPPTTGDQPPTHSRAHTRDHRRDEGDDRDDSSATQALSPTQAEDRQQAHHRTGPTRRHLADVHPDGARP